MRVCIRTSTIFTYVQKCVLCMYFIGTHTTSLDSINPEYALYDDEQLVGGIQLCKNPDMQTENYYYRNT